jgi:hypothetical protein
MFILEVLTLYDVKCLFVILNQKFKEKTRKRNNTGFENVHICFCFQWSAKSGPLHQVWKMVYFCIIKHTAVLCPKAVFRAISADIKGELDKFCK